MRQAGRLPLEQLTPYLLEVPEAPAPFDWRAVFGNEHPVEVEIGFGKGLFLVTAAQACPGVNFLGIEVVRKYQLFTATRVAKRDLANVRLAKADARAFLRDCVAPASVQAVHVYFPDPWWKKRHHKRRVFIPAPPGLKEPQHDLDYLTNFERKFRKEGRPIYRAVYERADVPS